MDKPELIGVDLGTDDITVVRADTPTPRLRWLAKAGTTTESPRLQQYYRVEISSYSRAGLTGSSEYYEWRDVPTEVAE